SGFGASSVDFDITWWTGNGSKAADIRGSRDEVIEAVKKALDDAGIEIPYPYRTMTFKNEGVPVKIDEAA
ncbi:MAG: mechanosensitive ion channel family protein, partial [Gammaproteobacteria bacterium]|nr:mechanosensitive ion channel family protein [Gammaproteobacteria bacterium]